MLELMKIQEKFEVNQDPYYAASYISPFIVLTYLEAVDVTFLGSPLLLSANVMRGWGVCTNHSSARAAADQ